MEATLRAGLRAGIFKSLLDYTKDLWTCANFVFSEDDGLSMGAMDSSHVALASLALKPAAFSSFQCRERVTLGIHFDALSMVLKSCTVDDKIELEYTIGNDYITIMRGGDRQWELKLLNIEEDEMIVPEQHHDVTATMPSSELHKVCRDLKDIGGETISIRVSQGDEGDEGWAISCSVEGNHGRATAVLKECVCVECALEIACSYGLRFIASFAKGSPLCSTVHLRFGKETPLCLTYEDEDGHGSLQFFLASRIDEDDD